MTMIAITTHDDRAEIVTDSLAYSVGVRFLANSGEKVHRLDHLATAVVTQGWDLFTSRWSAVRDAAADVASLDELVPVTATLAREAWSAALAEAAAHGIEPNGAFGGALFLVGYSPAAGRFAAWLFAEPFDFEPRQLGPTYLMPAPLDVQAGPLEEARFSELHREQFGTDELIRVWAAEPPLEAPTSVDEWVTVARRSHALRSAIGFDNYSLKVLTGGDVWMHTITRDSTTRERIYEIPLAGPDFEKMVLGTMHPLSQLAPCPCGNGIILDCMLKDWGDNPCDCGSGEVFADCCSVRAGERRAEPKPLELAS